MALDLTIYRGNTDTRTVTVTSSGSAFDLTGYTIKFIVKPSVSVGDAAASINVAVVVSAPATGIGTLSLTHANTDITPGCYVCEFKLYDSGGTYIKTLDIGRLTIKDVVLFEVS